MNPKPSVPEAESGRKIKITVRPMNAEQAIVRLGEIFNELQASHHDQWDWLAASFCVEVLRCEIERAEPAASLPEPRMKSDGSREVRDILIAVRFAAFGGKTVAVGTYGKDGAFGGKELMLSFDLITRIDNFLGKEERYK